MEHLVIDVSPMTKKGICIIEDMDDSQQVQQYFESVYAFIDRPSHASSKSDSNQIQEKFNQLFQIENLLKQTVAINYKLYASILDKQQRLDNQYNLMKDDSFIAEQKLSRIRKDNEELQNGQQESESKSYALKDQIQDLEKQISCSEQKRNSYKKGDVERLQRDSLHLEEVQDEIDYQLDIQASQQLQNQKYKQRKQEYQLELQQTKAHNVNAVQKTNLYKQKLINMKQQLQNQKNINCDNKNQIQFAEDKYLKQQEIQKQLQIRILTAQRDILAAEQKHSYKSLIKRQQQLQQQYNIEFENNEDLSKTVSRNVNQFDLLSVDNSHQQQDNLQNFRNSHKIFKKQLAKISQKNTEHHLVLENEEMSCIYSDLNNYDMEMKQSNSQQSHRISYNNCQQRLTYNNYQQSVDNNEPQIKQASNEKNNQQPITNNTNHSNNKRVVTPYIDNSYQDDSKMNKYTDDSKLPNKQEKNSEASEMILKYIQNITLTGIIISVIYYHVIKD